MWPVSAARISAAACRSSLSRAGRPGSWPAAPPRRPGRLAGRRPGTGRRRWCRRRRRSDAAGRPDRRGPGGWPGCTASARRGRAGPGRRRGRAATRPVRPNTPPDRLVHGRGRRAVVVGVAAGIGSGVQQQPHALGVVEADRRGQRHLGQAGHVGDVAQQQPQALVVVAPNPARYRSWSSGTAPCSSSSATTGGLAEPATAQRSGVQPPRARRRGRWGRPRRPGGSGPRPAGRRPGPGRAGATGGAGRVQRRPAVGRRPG